MTTSVNNHYLGLAAEYRVVSELLMRDLNPARYMFDDGVDIVIKNGKRLQVRTARPAIRSKSGRKTYICNLRGGRRRDHKLIEDDFDYLVFWLAGTDDFYIYPKEQLPNCWHINITHGGRTQRHESFRNRWDLLN